jgi:hypothetical protein
MNCKYNWNIDLPIKLFDTDIDNEKLLGYINNDNRFNELLSAKAMLIFEHSINQYSDCLLLPQNCIGVVNDIYVKDGNPYANVDMLMNLPHVHIMKEIYDLLHIDDYSVYYIAPHGTKENGRIIDISNFTLWRYLSH